MVRRWNGWADEGEAPHLPGAARAWLAALVGPGRPPHDARLDEVAARLPPSRLAALPQVSTEPVERIRHATGQSFPDWVALRSGRLTAPDAVAHPTDGEAVRAILGAAAGAGAAVIPYGGGTSVVGGVTPAPGERPVLTVALDRLAGLRALDARSGLATFGSGTTGPAVEASLAPHGLAVGHTPQSWERATVGGWVAARGTGHRSTGVGRIEALFAGGTVETPAGRIVLPPHPASAAGPDLRQLVLGSEGRLGVLTDVILRASPAPARTELRTWLLPGWEAGLEATRALALARLPLAMVRCWTPLETASAFAIAGRPAATRLAQGWLRLRGRGGEPAVVIVAAAGARRVVGAALAEAAELLRAHGALRAPGAIGRRWEAGRYRSAALRDHLWELGYGIDTIETAATWDRLPALAAALGRGLRHGLEDHGERVHAFSHLSHPYGSGSSLYTTLVFRLADDPDETLERWRTLKAIAGREIVEHGATISHQHGVGRDHVPWMAAEKGPLGLAAIDAARRVLDPDGLMNRGVLLPELPDR